MSSQLEKLKCSIKQEIAKDFGINLMKTSGFIPVDKKQSDFYVIIDKSKASNKSKIESIVKEKFADLAPKFIPIEPTDFASIINFLSEKFEVNSVASTSQEDSKPEENASEPSAEEMLVTIGWITKAQLNECIIEADRRKVPLDAIFMDKDYLSYERVVSYLQKKFGCEVVSKSNIVTDKNILKIFAILLTCYNNIAIIIPTI